MTYDRKGRLFEYAVPFGVLLLASAVAVGCGDDEPATADGDAGSGDTMIDAGGTMNNGDGDASMSEDDAGGGGRSLEQCVIQDCMQYVSGAGGAMAAAGAMNEDGMNCFFEVCGPAECAPFFGEGSDGGTGGGGTDAGTGSSDAGMGTGDGGTDPVDECLAQQPEANFDMSNFTEACGRCACECNPEAFSQCGPSCWGLVRCIQENCPDAAGGG